MTPDIISIIALTLGASWASGINLYATIVALGIMGNMGTVELPAGLDIVTDPLVIGAAGVMYFFEFFADKIPGLDSTWDALHTFIRIPAGVAMAYGATSELGMPVAVAASILGGGMAGASHATKAGSRLVINASPEPFTNWIASVGEDISVVGGLWMALHYPWLFIVFMVLFILLMIWMLPKIWRAIKAMVKKIKGWVSKKEPTLAIEEQENT